MKRILLVVFLCWSVGKVVAIGPAWDMISLLKVPTDTTWEIGLKFGYRLPDSVKLISNGDTIKFIPAERTSYKRYESDTILIKKKHRLSLHPQQGKLIAYFYSSNYDQKYVNIDSVIYGSLPNAICSSLGGTRTFNHKQTSYYVRRMWLSEDGKEDITGFTWRGVLYDYKGNRFRSINADISQYDYLTTTASYPISVDSNGEFTCNVMDSPIFLEYLYVNERHFATVGNSLIGKIGDTVVSDIHLIVYLDAPEDEANKQLNVNIANNTAHIFYTSSQAAHLSVYSVGGQCVWEQLTPPCDNKQEVSICNLKTGIYVCKLQTANDKGQTCVFVVK